MLQIRKDQNHLREVYSCKVCIFITHIDGQDSVCRYVNFENKRELTFLSLRQRQEKQIVCMRKQKENNRCVHSKVGNILLLCECAVLLVCLFVLLLFCFYVCLCFRTKISIRLFGHSELV